jgi:hypothetical protein
MTDPKDVSEPDDACAPDLTSEEAAMTGHVGAAATGDGGPIPQLDAESIDPAPPSEPDIDSGMVSSGEGEGGGGGARPA